MTATEASAWRERITIWQRFRLGRQVESPKPVAASPVREDPSPF
jgi:hypothetical protein